MRRVLLFLFALFCAVPVFSQAKHPFTFEDMMALKRVGEPEVSPDGKWVIFSMVDVDLAANKKTPHVWIVPLVGGESREIISDQDANRPRWAPDRKRFAFISSKEGGSQIWIADFDGSAGKVTGVHKLTSIATEADSELWSPDGKNILFTSNVYPECMGSPAEIETCNKQKLKESADSKVRAMIFDHLLYRHWNGYKESKRSHLLVVPADACVGTAAPGCPAGAARDLTPGDHDAPQFSLGGQDNYAFSPDGQEICYTSNHDEVEATSTNNDLWLVSVNGGPSKNITAENKASDSTPLYSPDGKYIAYRAQKRPGYESDRFRLMLYDRKTGEKKDLTENFDRWVNAFTWTPDSRQLYFTAENKGKSPILRIESTGAGLSILSGCTGPYGAFTFDDLQFSPDGKTLLTSGSGVAVPIEIFAFDTREVAPCSESGIGTTKKPSNIEIEFERGHGFWFTKSIGSAQVTWEQITHFSDQIREPYMSGHFSYDSPLEDFWFYGANRDPVEGFLVKPPNFDPNKKYPVKFLIHGGPEGAWGDDWSYRWNPELFAANGYVVIMINFHGSTGYGQKFIDAINGDWGGAPFEDLMKGLDYAEKTYPFIDKDRECALGASYGGYMTNWILGHTDRFKCIVTHDGMFNTEAAWGTTEELWFNEWEFKGTPYNNRELYRKWSPHLSATNFKTPTLVVHGQLDYRLDVSEGFQLFTTLQRLKVPSKMLYFPDEGHWVLKPQNSQLWYKTVNDWVDQWLKK
jgi:dipeptidyl aminopeptidase/acylaminoacyl peptidase